MPLQQRAATARESGKSGTIQASSYAAGRLEVGRLVVHPEHLVDAFLASGGVRRDIPFRQFVAMKGLLTRGLSSKPGSSV